MEKFKILVIFIIVMSLYFLIGLFDSKNIDETSIHIIKLTILYVDLILLGAVLESDFTIPLSSKKIIVNIILVFLSIIFVLFFNISVNFINSQPEFKSIFVITLSFVSNYIVDKFIFSKNKTA